jgi:peptidyl-prolyl cis-trans isomerase C
MSKITHYTISLFAAGHLLAQTPQAPPKIMPGTPAAAGIPAPVVKPEPAPLGPDAVVIIIGDQKITKAQYESFINALPERIRTEATGPNKRKVAEQLADIKALAQEARKLGIDKKPDMQVQINFQVENFLANALFQQLQAEVKSDDAGVKEFYEKNKKDYETATARHILVRFAGSKVPLKEGQKDLTDAEALAKAQELQKQIKGGKDFAEVAKAESDDTGSGAQGGSLGTFGHGQMVPEFENPAFTLPIDQVSDPVKSPFGYHLIQVQARTAKTLAEVRPEIEAKMKPEMARKAIEDLRKQANITLDENYFGK